MKKLYKYIAGIAVLGALIYLAFNWKYVGFKLGVYNETRTAEATETKTNEYGAGFGTFG